MAGTPFGSEKNAKRGTARPHFLRRRNLIIALAVVLIGAGAFFAAASWLNSTNQREHTEAAKSLEKGEYRQAYDKLKAVDGRGGTAEKNGEQGYLYYLDLARTAYLAGDDKDAKRYAEEGLRRLPPEDSDAYFTAQDAALSLVELRDGRYSDPLEYEADMPTAGEQR